MQVLYKVIKATEVFFLFFTGYLSYFSWSCHVCLDFSVINVLWLVDPDIVSKYIYSQQVSSVAISFPKFYKESYKIIHSYPLTCISGLSKFRMIGYLEIYVYVCVCVHMCV